MTFIPHHYGLYFNEEQMQAAKNGRAKEPLTWAWAWLNSEVGTTIRQRSTPTHEDKKATTPLLKPEVSALGQALLWAYRYRGLDDVDAGTLALETLRNGAGFDDSPTYTETLQTLIGVAQLFEMLRNHPDIRTFGNQWLSAFHDRVDALTVIEAPHSYDTVWQNTLHIVAGVVLESQRELEQGIIGIQKIVDSIHPEGFLKEAVEGGDEGSLWRMLTTVSALTLGAEAATLVGENLWAYENRGVGIGTAATYMVYYYFYPDKWKWSSGITTDQTRQLFIEQGAFIEIAAYRAPLRGVDILLDDQRPLFSALNGGLTTLTHALKTIPEKKKRGWLW